jgi:hypothetical protein
VILSPYKDKRWRAVRLVVLERDGYRCQLRYPKCKGRASHVDHVVDWRDNPALAFEPANLRASCASCNVAQRNRRVAARARGARTASPRSRDWSGGSDSSSVDSPRTGQVPTICVSKNMGGAVGGSKSSGGNDGSMRRVTPFLPLSPQPEGAAPPEVIVIGDDEPAEASEPAWMKDAPHWRGWWRG